MANCGELQKNGIPDDLKFEVFKGLVGEGFSIEYTAYLKVFDKVPTFEDIVSAPEKVGVPELPDLLFAVAGVIGDKLDKKNMGKVIKYIQRLPVEFQVIILTNARVKDKQIQDAPDFTKWVLEHKEIFFS